MINSKLQNDDFIELDYNKIKNDINTNIENNIKSVKRMRINFKKLVYYSLFVLLLCGITILTTTLTYKNHIMANHELHSSKCPVCNKLDPGVSEPGGSQGIISPTKFPKDVTMLKEFDLCVAFSGNYSSSSNFIPLSKFLLTDLLKEEDKLQLIKTFNLRTDIIDNSVSCNFYLLTDEGKDYIFIKQLNGEFKEFVFESNFAYDFMSIVKDFETLSGTTLTEEWLNDAKYDTMGNLTTGISIYFKEVEPGIYKEYYTAIINNQVYVINK